MIHDGRPGENRLLKECVPCNEKTSHSPGFEGMQTFLEETSSLPCLIRKKRSKLKSWEEYNDVIYGDRALQKP
jgi:hypothetical protein